MKKVTFLSSVLLAAVLLINSSCDDKRSPGKIYMPDMAYSRAIETYAALSGESFTNDPARIGKEIFYNAQPVAGTISINDLAEYSLPNTDSGYAQSAQVKNPLPPLAGKDSAEAARLFNIYCAICHGADGKANGPLATSGKIGGVANLAADAYIKMADGTMYHSIFYGKNNMGSYASQLSRTQRWQLVQYIRNLQPKAEAVKAGADSTKMAGKS